MTQAEDRSPVLSLQNAISGASFRIAPEREQELARWRDHNGFTLALSEGAGFDIRVNTSTHEATLPIATLEYLWCSAHAFAIFYDEYAKALRAGAEKLDMGASNRIRSAMELLNWALTNMETTGKEPWPSAFPRPAQLPSHGSDIHVANELFLCATAWILHHEIAHVSLGHTRQHRLYTIRQEREADVEATQWILSLSSVEQESRKRILGVAAAILAMQLLEKPGSDASTRTHPRALERLHYCLDKAAIPSDHIVYQFATVILQIQLAQHSVEVSLDGESARDILETLTIAFVRAKVT